MKLSPEEKAKLRKQFLQMKTADKVDYCFTYYKTHIIAIILILIIVVSTAVRVSAKKETMLYLSMVNVSFGSVMEEHLTSGFLEQLGYSDNKHEIYVYKDLYLSDNPTSENHEYEYASQMKILAAINSKEMDLVIMNREAYDIFSQNGYLMNISDAFSQGDQALLNRLAPYIISNEIILSDNSIDVALGEAAERVYESMPSKNGIIVSDLPFFKAAGFSDDVYIGIIANTPRMQFVTKYLKYIIP